MNMTTMTHEDSMREMIIKNVEIGLAEADAGLGEEANDEFWANLKKECHRRINKK